MILALSIKNKTKNPWSEWVRWFAWYPVPCEMEYVHRPGDVKVTTEWVWWEWVEYKYARDADLIFCIFRRPA